MFSIRCQILIFLSTDMNTILCAFFVNSTTWVHSTSHPGHGHSLPGKVWHGKNCSVCPGHATTAGACYRAGEWSLVLTICKFSVCDVGSCNLKHCYLSTGLRVSHVSHQRAGISDQQRVWTILQVHAICEGEGIWISFIWFVLLFWFSVTVGGGSIISTVHEKHLPFTVYLL